MEKKKKKQRPHRWEMQQRPMYGTSSKQHYTTGNRKIEETRERGGGSDVEEKPMQWDFDFLIEWSFPLVGHWNEAAEDDRVKVYDRA